MHVLDMDDTQSSGKTNYVIKKPPDVDVQSFKSFESVAYRYSNDSYGVYYMGEKTFLRRSQFVRISRSYFPQRFAWCSHQGWASSVHRCWIILTNRIWLRKHSARGLSCRWYTGRCQFQFEWIMWKPLHQRFHRHVSTRHSLTLKIQLTLTLFECPAIKRIDRTD